MKLNLVAAGTGLQWVKEGIQTFFKQPIALSGLLFIYGLFFALTLQLSWVGLIVLVTLAPAFTLGMMVATREVTLGRFPKPSVLLSAFRGGPQRTRSMLTLGVMYLMLVMLVTGISTLAAPAELTTGGTRADVGLVLVALLRLPLLLMFWHAPALVYWHGITPAKSLFFSLIACLRNIRALLVYGLAWVGVTVVVSIVMGLVVMATGNAAAAGVVLLPSLFMLGALTLTSLYFTFRDSFIAPDNAELQEVATS